MTMSTVFISYCHKDEAWKDRLVTQLGVLQQEISLDLWDDRRIGAGEDWYQKIQEAIARASVAVLLVSADFLTSNFILSKEIPSLLERRDNEGLRIFPVIIRPCPWKHVKWLARMNIRPNDGKPISSGAEHQIDADLAAIADEVAAIIESELPKTPLGTSSTTAPEKISLAKRPSTDIFISYANEDRGKAKDIAEALVEQGFSVWWDRSILPGETLDTAIENALDTAKCVIVLWSKTSVSSEWVKAEASEGKQRGIIIPVLIDDVKLPLGFRLMQFADLRDWGGKLPHPGFDNLLKAVERILGRLVQPSQKTKSVNSIGMKFTLITAGKFYMGSEESGDEKTVREVKINNPFYLGTYPVTQREWKAVMGSNPSYFKGGDLPVEQVSWEEVQEFIRKLNEREGTDKYRLPSEAEWEYACRAGTTTRYSFGDSDSELGDYGWYAENSGSRSPKTGDYFGYDKEDWLENRWKGKTHSVGQKKPNPWGLYDMHGNVWEWVQDEWHDSYDGAPTDGSAWESGDGPDRVFRGGSWLYYAGFCRSALRLRDDPRLRRVILGFRLLQEL